MKHFRNPDTIHQPLAGYTHHIEVTGGERFLFMSGQVGMDPDGDLPPDPYEQLALALDNVLLNLEAAGMTLTDLTKITFYIAGEMDADRRREIIEDRFKGHQPCMTLLYVAALASPALKVEVDAFAMSDA